MLKFVERTGAQTEGLAQVLALWQQLEIRAPELGRCRRATAPVRQVCLLACVPLRACVSVVPPIMRTHVCACTYSAVARVRPTL